MVNEDVYQKIAEQIAKAKEQLDRAKDIREFAKDANIPLSVSDAEIEELEEKIRNYETALAKRGFLLTE